jgi:predicted ATPase
MFMKASPITKIIIKRFRSFPTATLTFDNPLFVVGRNGSGKSNLADVFSFVSEAMASPLQAVFDRRGGIRVVQSQILRKEYFPPNLGLAFEFGPINGIAGGRFAFEAEALPHYGFRIFREQCLVRQQDGSRWWYDRTDKWKSNVHGLAPGLDPAALALPLVGGNERFAPIFRLLGAMRVYSIQPAKLRELQDPDGGVTLRPDGSNAASVLQELLRGDDAGATLAEINRFLEAIVPATTAVSPKELGTKLSLNFSQAWEMGNRLVSSEFHAFNMSDGTLRSLGLILAVFQKPSPSLLVIEEPEATIHPGALGAILDLIRKAAKTMQVVVTTHSPDLLEDKWIKDQNIRIVTWEDGASHLLHPSEATREAMRSHIMGAGELLRSNGLQPEPLFKEEGELRHANLFEILE